MPESCSIHGDRSINVDIDAGDIEIGAVELKDATTDNRQAVAADGRAAVDANLQVGNTDSPGGAGASSASTPRTVTASDSPEVTVLGATGDAAVDTDTTGTVSGKLRGLVKLMVNLLSRWPAALGAGGGLKTEPTPATTATLSNVNDTASSTTLLASAAGRRGVLAFNDSSSDLYLKYGATASATSFSVKIAAGQYWEMPKPIYTGVIDGIWSADSTGAVRLTELT